MDQNGNNKELYEVGFVLLIIVMVSFFIPPLFPIALLLVGIVALLVHLSDHEDDQ